MHVKKRGAARARLNQTEIVEILSRSLTTDVGVEAFPGFLIRRWSTPTRSLSTVYQPAFCYVAQGIKQAEIGGEIVTYGPDRYMIYTIDLPMIFRINEASLNRPFLGLALKLDPAIVTSVITESGLRIEKLGANAKAFTVGSMSAELLDALVRMVRLVEAPAADRKLLAPMIIKEIVYRLLLDGQGARLSHFLAPGTGRIATAITHLRDHFNKPLRIDEIASEFGMSVSSFHHRFKHVTGMSPIQYQKQLRLQEARRLMLSDDLDAANAGLRVGYEDPSYFSRDYKKRFGAPPQRDIAKLRSEL